MRYEPGSTKIFLFFHANAEDLGRAYMLLSYVQSIMKTHVIAVEYPGYGVYSTDQGPSAESIIKDAETVYKFIRDELGWHESDIIVAGKSIGSGPAC